MTRALPFASLLAALFLAPACALSQPAGPAWNAGAPEAAVEVRVRCQVRGVETGSTRGTFKQGRPIAVFEVVNGTTTAQRLTLAWEWRDSAGLRLEGEDARLEQNLVLRPGEARTFTRRTEDPTAVLFVGRIRTT